MRYFSGSFIGFYCNETASLQRQAFFVLLRKITIKTIDKIRIKPVVQAGYNKFAEDIDLFLESFVFVICKL